MSVAASVRDVVDCREMEPDAHPAAALEAFDGLVPGQRLRLVCASPPVGVLRALQARRAGAFEWSPLREGPRLWEVQVQRRAAAVGSRRAVTEALVWDHDRLDALEQSAFAVRVRGAFGLARDLFAEFGHGLRRHIDFEEHLLFPEFEARSTIAGEHGPTAVMRAEHRAIVTLLAIMEGEIGHPQAPVELSRVELRRILHDHDLKEERILYPALDRLLDAGESDVMVARIQAWTRG